MSRNPSKTIGFQNINQMRRTTDSKRFIARGSAAMTSATPLFAEEAIVKVNKRRRSSFNTKDSMLFDDEVDLNDMHVMGSNDILEQMKIYVDQEYKKQTKGIGRLKFKKLWKKVRGKELNEEYEKNRLRQRFIYEHLDPVQREMFEEELLEVDLDRENDTDPMLEIVTKIAIKNQGTCKCQVLRSSDNWSTGIKQSESSILNAYLDLIKGSKKFIY